MEKLIIIGSGPAGWTAALYAARANLQPLVFAGRPGLMQPGGQLMFTTEVENYPGYVVGVDGPEMMRQFRDQALRFGTRIMTDDGPQSEVKKSGDDEIVYHFQDVQSVDFANGSPFSVVGDDGKKHQAKVVIIATGARANYLGLESEQKFLNRGVSGCAVCDGALPRFRNKPVAVIGGGDSAVEEATYLTHFASRVFLVHRRSELRASKIMADRALNNPKIQPLWNSTVEEVLGDDDNGVTSLKLKNTASGETDTLETSGMFLGIGHTPNTDFLGRQLDLTPEKYVRVKGARPYFTATSVPGVFAAGDVADDLYRQAVTAAGTGCMSALDAERYLSMTAHGDA
jgi:thioredoxin reductase (NADPH)